ncbi:MAG: tRNA (5-methylaminomethyl-2-thiouridine)(34)-methyltransferase MnmD [Pseudomonadota bacterium]
MHTDQTARILWHEGRTPVSERFDDVYFSPVNGLDETRHVFLKGNDLPGRFRAGFHVAELGFGTGLNVLAAVMMWRAANARGTLHFTSFEASPMAREDLFAALGAFPAIRVLASEILADYAPGKTRMHATDLRLNIIWGDARETLPAWKGQADAWFLDGFSPAKNPELWSDELMAQVARRTAPDGSFATYTAAGHVRRALAQAGFTVARMPGYGRKKHMTTGRLTSG